MCLFGHNAQRTLPSWPGSITRHECDGNGAVWVLEEVQRIAMPSWNIMRATAM